MAGRSGVGPESPVMDFGISKLSLDPSIRGSHLGGFLVPCSGLWVTGGLRVESRGDRCSGGPPVTESHDALNTTSYA